MTTLDAQSIGLDGGLIEASAGTGKTHTITTLFVRLLLERGLGVGEILVVTFTTAATAELRDRIRSRLRDDLAAIDADRTPASAERARAGARLRAALRDFDEAAIFTIHGLCQRVLQGHAFESGVSFDAELAPDQRRLLAEVVADYWARSLYEAAPAWVRHVVAAGHTPESLLELASLGVSDPEMALVPSAGGLDAIDAAEAALEQATAAAAAIWSTERGRVLELLATLSGTQYRKASLPVWASTMDAVLARSPAGGVEAFEKFFRFTNAGVADGLKKGQRAPSHPFFDACDALDAASRDVAAAVHARVLAFRRELVAFARLEVPRRKRAVRTQGFDDLLRLLDHALRGPRGPALAHLIKKTYAVALIDEFQDTDPVQYRIFDAIYGVDAALGMFLIGDPKQAIYSFRGADVFAYLRAARAALPGTPRFTLDVNYRSDPALIAAVNALFARVESPFLLDHIGYTRVAPAPAAVERLDAGEAPRAALRLLFVRREAGSGKPLAKGWASARLPGAIAADIARLLRAGATIDGRPVSAGDVAVLVRKNAQAAAIQSALRALRVPSVVQGDASVFDAPEAVELTRVLAAMVEPSRASAVRLALSTSLFGLDASAIHALETDDAAWDRWVLRFLAWSKRWAEHGFIAAFWQLLDQQGAAARLLRLVDGERRLTNVLHLAELLHVVSAREHLGPAGLLRWLTSVRRDAEARGRFGAEAAQVRLESDALAVKVCTIHKSKGLEYPIVYCPYLWDGKLLGRDAGAALRFHDPAHDHRQTLDLGSPDRAAHERLAAREAAAENLRLLYVALTRAKHQLAVVWGSFNEADTSALGYLLHQPSEGAADLFEATRARLAALDDDAMLRDLEALAASAPGAIGVEALSFASAAPLAPAGGRGASLRARELTRVVDRTWRASSFTALVSAGGAEAARDAEGRDRDARAAAIDAPAVPAAAPVPLHAFPRGARPGELIHKVLEVCDFAAPEASVVEQLKAFGLGVDAWKDVLTRALTDVLATPLCTPGAPAALPLELRRVPREKRLPELEFTFPLGDRGRLVTRAALADAFAEHARAPVPEGYAASLRALPFAPLQGFLRGFVDLVFEHEGRYYLVDWKSNFLGARPADYAEHLLGPVMAHAHYVLQYHLYAVALHRYLAQRLPGYDYDRHLGGVYYLFVRGMAPERGQATGVFADKPPRALIEALSTALAGGAS